MELSIRPKARVVVSVVFLLLASASAPAAQVMVAPGVYALLGDNGEISRANGGRIGNAGFIVGSTGVIAVDTGVSYLDGRRILDAISDRAALPVALAIVTHPVQEFLFGAAAFQDRGIPVLAHRETAQLMRERCGKCLMSLRKLLGDEAMRGSRVVTPDRLVDSGVRLQLAGRELELLHYGWAATPGDLAIFDRGSGVLFAGGLVSAGRVPLLRDGALEGWIAALEHLQKLPIRVIVPGHGPPGGPEQIRQMLDYLHQLEKAVRLQFSAGVSLSEALNQTPLPAFASWSQYAIIHPQNVQFLYRKLEDADFGSRNDPIDPTRTIPK